MGKQKKAQISIFLIVGVVLLITLSLISYIIFNSKIAEREKNLEVYDTSQLTPFVSNCLELSAINNLQKFGVKEKMLENAINPDIEKCVNEFEAFKEQGYVVTYQYPKVDVEIYEGVISFLLDYPIKLEKQDFVYEKSEFEYFVNRDNKYDLSLDRNRIMTKEVRLFSPDKKMELIIPKGTIVNKNEIRINIKNNDYDKDKYGLVIPLVYKFSDGLTFSRPATLIYYYDETPLPLLLDENSLRISYYDPDLDKMVELPTEVDTINKKIISQVEHFTDVTVTTNCNCLDLTQAKKELDIKKPGIIFDLIDANIYEQPLEYEEENGEPTGTTVECTKSSDCTVPYCENGGLGAANCVDGKCKSFCLCETYENCASGQICEEGICKVGEVTNGGDEEQTTYEEANITKTELPGGGYKYKFRMKPSDCNEEGVCFVALVVVDDSKVIWEGEEE